MDVMYPTQEYAKEILKILIDEVINDPDNRTSLERVLAEERPFNLYKDDFMKIIEIFPELWGNTESVKFGYRLTEATLNDSGKYIMESEEDLYDAIW